MNTTLHSVVQRVLNRCIPLLPTYRVENFESYAYILSFKSNESEISNSSSVLGALYFPVLGIHCVSTHLTAMFVAFLEQEQCFFKTVLYW